MDAPGTPPLSAGAEDWMSYASWCRSHPCIHGARVHAAMYSVNQICLSELVYRTTLMLASFQVHALPSVSVIVILLNIRDKVCGHMCIGWHCRRSAHHVRGSCSDRHGLAA